ncbi:MAG TPA: patatin-like phospholipase family protein [Candidatus Paceibacterota bacterium]|nr:patatin-like phospholipase family protein [Candidatus Paceibacterota bacterium]
MKFRGRPKIGLALSGGSAKGFAHIGVIKILTDAGISIDCIAGTSMGSMVGAFYAAGKDVGEIEQVAAVDKKQLLRLLDPQFKSGLLAGKKIDEFIGSHLRGVTFENCKTPLRIIATNLKTGEPVIFSDGEVVPAIRASISLPIIFNPVGYRDLLLADGGLAVPLPTRIVRQMGADVVIAVNVLAHTFTQLGEDDSTMPGPLGMANVSLDILMHNLAKEDTATADIVIAPEVGHYVSHQFDQGPRFIEIGADAARKALPAIRMAIDSKTSIWNKIFRPF